jgi:hypothetical protein
MRTAATPDSAVPLAPGVHWIGAFDPDLRNFDIILRTANGTSYNAYAVRGSAGVAVIDTVKANFADGFFRRLESVAATTRSPPSSSTTSNPTIPVRCRNCCAARRRPALRLAPGAADAQGPVRSGRIRGPHRPGGTGDTADLGDRRLEFFNTPYLHWPDTQCTWLAEEGILFSGRFPRLPLLRQRGCSTMPSATSASPSSTTTPTSCGPSAPMCARRWS